LTELCIGHLEWAASNARTWGLLLIFIFMAVESSFIPFPSEVVMIPAGFLAFRGDLALGLPIPDLVLAMAAGLAGSMAGAYVNYYLALFLGRPVLHKWGKYFFLPEAALDRAEEVFREYGDIATFVCRLLPAIRQLISIPAGLARMNFWRFSIFTVLGAGIWTAILALVGYYFGYLSRDMGYADLIHKGKAFISHNYLWLLIGLAGIVLAYIKVHNSVMKTKSPPLS